VVHGLTYGARQHKQCQKCKEDKEITDFYKNRNCTGGYDTTCKSCFKSRATEYYLNNKKTVLERHSKDWLSQKQRNLKKKYGMSLEDYVIQFTEQNGCCYICKEQHVLFDKAVNQLVVDHNHNTGKVRKLLCNKCNQGLGLFQDNFDLLTKAAEYLKEHKE